MAGADHEAALPTHLHVLILILSGACAAPERPTFCDADYPGTLRQPSALAFDVLWRQRVTAKWRDGQQGFDAAVQVLGDTLTVIGLSPAGQPGFVFVLDGDEVTSENRSGRELPFPPRYILLDVQRAFYPWLGDGVGVLGRRDDGTYERQVDGERVVEHWSEGRLRRRTFERSEGAPAGVIEVTYRWGDGMRAPVEAVLDNGWFGYTLTVATVEENALAGLDG